MPADDPAHEDEVFRQIVARFETESEDPVPPWPVAEDTADGSPSSLSAAPPLPPSVPPAATPAVPPEEALPGWLEPPALPDEEHYVPPAPPRLPRPHRRTVLGTVVLLFGLATLFAPYRFFLDDSPASLLFSMLVTAGGGHLLLRSLRDGPDIDDGPDNGAIV